MNAVNMNALKVAGMLGLCAASFLALGIAAAMAQDTAPATEISVTVFSSATQKVETDFSCIVASRGAVLGVIRTPDKFTLPRRLDDIAITCSKDGFEPVKMAMTGTPLPAQLNPRFIARAM